MQNQRLWEAQDICPFNVIDSLLLVSLVNDLLYPESAFSLTEKIVLPIHEKKNQLEMSPW